MTNEYLGCYQDIVAGRKVSIGIIKQALKFRIPQYLEGDGMCPTCGKLIKDESVNFLMDFCPFCGQAVRM